MKNILGTEEDLELFNKDGKRVYEFIKHSKVYVYENTYDLKGNQLTFKDSNGNSFEKTYDLKGNQLTYKSSSGYSNEYTYDSNGNVLTYKNSKGETIGFDIPEYTMEQLVEKLGNFKIKK